MIHMMQCFAKRLAVVSLAVWAVTAPVGAQDDRVIKVMHDLAPVSLNPTSLGNTSSARVIVHLFEGLVSYSTKDGYFPALAESWEISDDASVFRFRLREGIKWSDGHPITAADVSESFKLLSQLEDSYIADYLTAEDIVPVSEADGDYIEFHLADPNPNFLAIISDINSAVLPMHMTDQIDMMASWDHQSLPEAMPYSGAYVLSDVSDTHVSLRPNPEYYAPARVLNAGVDIEWIETEQDEEGIRRIRQGLIDLAYIRSTGQSEFIRDQLPDYFQFIRAPSTEKIWFNMQTAPFNNPDLRKAATLALAVDFPQSFIRSNYLAMQRSLIPDSMSATYTPEMPDWADGDHEAHFAEARRIMEGFGYSQSNPLKVELTVNTSTLHERMANLVVTRWNQIHMDVSLTVTDWSEYFPETLVKGNFQAARAGWLYDYNHPLSMLETFETGSGFNYGGYSNEAYDALIAELRKTFDVDKTDEISRAAMRQLYDDYVVVPLYSRGLAILREPGLVIGGSTHQGYLYYNEVHFDRRGNADAS